MKFENDLHKSTVLVGIAIMISIITLFLSSIEIANTDLFSMAFAQNTIPGGNNSSINNTTGMKVHNLTNTNVPVTLPLIKGYVNGHEVFYITTEASDKNVANHLTNLSNSRVVYTPSLKLTPEDALSTIYEFKNGVKGIGPQGFQPNVADSQPGEPAYSPLWRIQLVEWKPNTTAVELKSQSDIIKAQKDGKLTITPTDIIVNCPFVKWNGGELQVRTDKTLNDSTAYGGGQVLDIDTTNSKVTFVGHLGFAPNGDIIHYIATDASKMDVANALGVIFVNKTDYTLNSGSSSDLYVFTNGITGTGPMGFQASIASSNAGDISYSPMWRIQGVTWKDLSQADLLTDMEQLGSAVSNGTVEVGSAGVVVNCPFVEVSNTLS
jgi:hypothetical protein